MTPKKSPDISEEELAELRIMFALRRMSAELQSNVLSDGEIAAKAGIGVSNPVKLPGNVTVDRSVLFNAFQKAIDGESLSHVVDSSGTERKVSFEVDGASVVLKYEAFRVHFPQAALLTAQARRRNEIGELCLQNHTLTVQATAEFRLLIAKTDFSTADFYAASTILAGAPENFADQLKEVAKKGTLARRNFLPDHIGYWENITARRVSSETLSDFVAGELAEERRKRLAQNPDVALDLISLTFISPELVTCDLVSGMEGDKLFADLRQFLERPDPFALTGAFSICALRVSSDERFVELGNDILDRILGDPTRLVDELGTFAAALVIAGAYLAQHETLRHQPPFWRRLAAASHACLVARVLGPDSGEDAGLFKWAMRIVGKTFYLSVLRDAHSEPRWRPDWASPKFLAADVYGRLNESVRLMGESAPIGWKDKVESAGSWIAEGSMPFAHAFPSLLQGERSPSIEKPLPGTPIGDIYAQFDQEPTVENFLNFLQVVYVFGFHPDGREAVLKTVRSLRTEDSQSSSVLVQAALELAAFIAARNLDTELADAVANAAIERIVAGEDIDNVLPTAAIILECSAAFADRNEATSLLAKRLENLAYVAPPEMQPEVLDILSILRSIDEDLSARLGRAIATSRLGMPRVVV